MNIILPFIFGFLAALVGVLPPGLINMSAAKISLTNGKKQAMVFVLGATLVVTIQTCIAVIFGKSIDRNKQVVVLLREVGFFIFLALTLYFFFFAKKPKTENKNLKIKSKRNHFFSGMVISAINVFPIPYYVFITITLTSYNVFNYQMAQIAALISGIVLGSFTVFYFYVVFFNTMNSKADYLVKNMNIILGTITGLIGILTLFNILQS